MRHVSRRAIGVDRRAGRVRLVARLAEAPRERERRADPVRDELRALPHRGLVGVRPDRAAEPRRRRRHPRSVRRWRGYRTAVPASTCATAARSGGSAPTHPAGSQSQVDFVSMGSDNQKPTASGIGTGRMPGFGAMLTADQIKRSSRTSATASTATTTTASRPRARRRNEPAPAPTTTTTRCEGAGVVIMHRSLHLLAARSPKRTNIWNPTIIGILTVVAAVGLFCGSVYCCSARTSAARLGFLVAAAGLTGFMLLLATLWWTSGRSGIDPPHGTSPQWKVVEVVVEPADSKIKAVQDDHDQGHGAPRGQAREPQAGDRRRDRPRRPRSPARRRPTEPFATLGFTRRPTTSPTSRASRRTKSAAAPKNLFWHNAAVRGGRAVHPPTRPTSAPARVRSAEGHALRDPGARPRHAAPAGGVLLVLLAGRSSASRCSACTGTRRTSGNASRPTPRRV